MGADVICIKDMANLLLPYKAYSLVKRLKKETDLPIVLHTHNTTGTGDMVLLKAIEAGVDVVDTCAVPAGLRHVSAGDRIPRCDPEGHGIRHGLRPRPAGAAGGALPHGGGSPDQGRLA